MQHAGQLQLHALAAGTPPSALHVQSSTAAASRPVVMAPALRRAWHRYICQYHYLQQLIMRMAVIVLRLSSAV